MSRYIDADVFKEQDFQDYSSSDVEYAINHCPTADVAEVKHGYWKGIGRCSICETFSLSSGTDYCPNCGAKMDDERKDEE